MDEPTSSLTENEVEHLFRIIARPARPGRRGHLHLAQDGGDPPDRRRGHDHAGRQAGRHLAGRASSPTDHHHQRDGRPRPDPPLPAARATSPGEVRAQGRGPHLAASPSSFKDVSFELRKGEILGIGGLVGAQRTELVESIFGLRRRRRARYPSTGRPASHPTRPSRRSARGWPSSPRTGATRASSPSSRCSRTCCHRQPRGRYIRDRAPRHERRDAGREASQSWSGSG